jgi:biotin transport system substrate-specific component
MTSRPLVSHASTILDQISMRAASANLWTGVQVLSVLFVVVLTAAAAQLSFPLAFSPELPQGFARVLGPTGGYLMAYPIAAFATGLLAERGFDRRYLTSIVAMAVGLSIIFAGGVAWIARFSGLEVALATGLYPFIVVDLIKVVVAGLVLPTAWKFLR